MSRKFSSRMPRQTVVLVLPALLAGCAVSLPRPDPAALRPQAQSWQAPVAANVIAREAWWAAWNDPVLDALLAAARSSHPGLQQADARIAEARARAAAAGAALWPAVKLNAGSIRSRDGTMQPGVAQTNLAARLDSSWEIDLWGGVAAVREGILATLAAREAEREDAWTSLAGELANALMAYRSLHGQHELLLQELRSRELSLSLAQSRQRAGLGSQVEASLLDSAVADTRNQVAETGANADVMVKVLVALTGLEESALRAQLARAGSEWRLPPTVLVDTVPARVLQQRPDIRSAMASVEVAAAEVAVAEVNRYPSLTLTGSVGRAQLDDGHRISASTWSFGPSLSVPLLNAGRLKALQQAAFEHYQESVANLQGQMRHAVREVEEALLRLDAGRRRADDLQRSVAAYQSQFAAIEARWRVGSASLGELEDARRAWLAQAGRQLALQRELASYAIALYKAVGGNYHPGVAQP